MSKKTRKQKRLAEQRKEMKLSIQVKELAQETSTDTVLEKKPHSYFITDFRKSLIIIAGIITLEIVIYFVTIK